MVALQIVPGGGEWYRALSKAHTRLRRLLGPLKGHVDVAMLAEVVVRACYSAQIWLG